MNACLLTANCLILCVCLGDGVPQKMTHSFNGRDLGCHPFSNYIDEIKAQMDLILAIQKVTFYDSNINAILVSKLCQPSFNIQMK